MWQLFVYAGRIFVGIELCMNEMKMRMKTLSEKSGIPIEKSVLWRYDKQEQFVNRLKK